MTASNFDISLKRVLVHEGEYSNDAGDPGGPTMWGITHIDYDAFRKMKGLPTQDVRNMAIIERDEIYRNKYWKGSRCDELPSGVDYAVFDGAVNSGVSQSVKWLQRALWGREQIPGKTADGNIGDVTVNAAKSAGDPKALVNSICDQRQAFLESLRTFSRFGKGWTERVKEVRAAGVLMAVSSAQIPKAPTPPNQVIDGSIKASAKDASSPMVSPETATAGTSISAIGSGISQAAESIQGLADIAPILKWTFIGLTLVALGITIYALWSKNKITEATA